MRTLPAIAFRLGFVASAAILLLFAWVAAPAAITLARGGDARLWFFGGSLPVVAFAAVYVGVALLAWARRRWRTRNRAGIMR